MSRRADIDRRQRNRAYATEWRAQGMKIADIAKRLAVSRPTVYSYLNCIDVVEREEILMEGVRDSDGEETVYLSYGLDGRPLVKTNIDEGYNAAEVDLLDLLRWLRKHRPDLLGGQGGA